MVKLIVYYKKQKKKKHEMALKLPKCVPHLPGNALREPTGWRANPCNQLGRLNMALSTRPDVSWVQLIAPALRSRCCTAYKTLPSLKPSLDNASLFSQSSWHNPAQLRYPAQETSAERDMPDPKHAAAPSARQTVAPVSTYTLLKDFKNEEIFL